MSDSDPVGEQHYWCFISYRHADNREQDRGWATWLHQEIERYEVPAELVGTANVRGDTIPERIYPVFRDAESLPAGADLSHSIVDALDRSRFLVVLCSPRAVESQYVSQEIVYFKKRGRSDRIIAAIIDGEPNVSRDRGKQRAGLDVALECFPKPLRHPVNSEGQLDYARQTEPVAADFRLEDGTQGFTSAESYRLTLTRTGLLEKSQIKARVDFYEQQLQLMKLKILAGILGVGLEQLRDRDRTYQLELAQRRARGLRRWLAVVGLLAVLALVGAAIALQQRNLAIANKEEAQRQAHEARRGEGQFWLELARQQVREGGSTVWPEAALFAAKSIGFEGFGRPAGAVPRSEIQRRFWNETHPLLLDPIQDDDGWQSALRLIHASDQAKPRARPLWRAAGERHHVDTVWDVAISPHGRWLASGDGHGWLKIWDMRSGRLTHSIRAHRNIIHAVEFSPNGNWLATASQDAGIKIWSPESADAVATCRGHADAVRALAFHPSEPLLASGSADGSIRIWQLPGGKTNMCIESAKGNQVWCVAFSPDGTQIAAGESSFDTNTNGQWALWDVNTGNEIRRVTTSYDVGVQSVTFHPDGKQLVSGEYHQTTSGNPLPDVGLTLWDANTGTELGRFEGHHHSVSSVRSDGDGSRLLSSSVDGTVRIWDMATRQVKFVLRGYEGSVYGAAWSPDGKTAAAGSAGGRIWLWDTATGKAKGRFQAPARSVAFSSDGNSLAVGAVDGSICIWDMKSGRSRFRIQAHETRVADIAFSPDGLTIASVGSGSLNLPAELKLWNAADGALVAKLWEHVYAMSQVAFSPDGKYVATGHGNGLVKVWEVASHTEILKLVHNNNAAVSCLAFSPDSQLLATGGYDFAVRFFELPGGRQSGQIDRPHRDLFIHDLAFSPDGRYLATAGGELARPPDTVKLWDVKTLDTRLVLPPDATQSVAFHPDGKTLATGSQDGVVRLWDVELDDPKEDEQSRREPSDSGSERLLATLTGHGGRVFGLAFARDGRQLATSGRIRLWDLHLGKPDRTLSVHENLVTDLGFSRNGKWLVSASGKILEPGLFRESGPAGEFKVWDFPALNTIWSSGPRTTPVVGAAIMPDGKRIACASAQGGGLGVWDVLGGEEILSLAGKPFTALTAMALSPDGNVAAVASGSPGVVSIWDLSTGKESMRAEIANSTVNDLAFKPDGQRLAAGTRDHLVYVMDLAGSITARLAGHRGAVESVAYSPDGKLLASGSSSLDRTIRVWDVETGIERLVLPGHQRFDSIVCLAFHPNGRILASGAVSVLQAEAAAEVKLWDMASGRETGSFQVPFAKILSLTFTLDGTQLLAGDDVGQLRIWRTEFVPWSQYLARGWLNLNRAARSVEWVDTTDHLLNEKNFERFVSDWEQ